MSITLHAQAPPGPITTPSRDLPPPRARAAAKKSSQSQIAPRTSIAGPWKFNRADSDDPRQIARSAERKNGPSGSGGNYPNGGGYPGGGYPGGGYPGGGYPGSPFPGQGGPRRGGGKDVEDNPKLAALLRPADTLTIDLKDPEIDVADEQSNMLVFYTDGRQVQKNSYNNRQEIAARWDGARLESDEKSPLGGKMSRTFELAPDGRRLYETLNIDKGKNNKKPIVIRYVYDEAGAEAFAPEDSDPDRPVLKRGSAEPDSRQQ